MNFGLREKDFSNCLAGSWSKTMRRDVSTALIRVLVADDTRVHTELLADVLRRDGHLQITTSTSGSEGLVRRSDFLDMDVLVIGATLDGQPGRGFEILRRLRASNPELCAVILLDAAHAGMILEAFRAGARGVFDPSDSIEALNKCVRRVFEGQIWANSRQVTTLAHALASSHNISAVDGRGLSLLSKRELEIVRGAARGMSNREIAEQLHISQHTVKNCLFRIFDKLGVSNRVELLFMTLSKDGGPSSARVAIFDDRGYICLGNEATLVACQKAADHGSLIAQVALAQFYATQPASIDAALRAYMWYSIASEQMARAYEDATRGLSMGDILQAEQMVGERRSKAGSNFRATATHTGPPHPNVGVKGRRGQVRKPGKVAEELVSA